MTLTKSTVKEVIVLLIIFGGYLLLNTKSLFILDDYWYSYSHVSNLPIENWKDVIYSQIYDWQHHSGRVFISAIVQYICGNQLLMAGYCINAACFTVLCLSIYRLLCLSESQPLVLCFIVVMLFVVIPIFGTTYLGNFSCTAGYLWPSAFNVLFILRFTKKTHLISWRSTILSMLLAFLAGIMQESFSIGIAFGVIFYSCYYRVSLEKKQKIMSIVYIIATIILLIAPGNYERLNETNANVPLLAGIMKRGLNIMAYTPFFCTLLLFLVAWFSIRKNDCSAFLKDNMFFLIASFVNSLFALFIVLTSPAQLICIELFAGILWLKLFYLWFEKKQSIYYLKKTLIYLCLLLVISLYPPIYYYRNQVHNAYEEAIRSARTTTDGSFVTTSFDYWSTHGRNWFVRKYSSTELDQNMNFKMLSLWLTKGKDANYVTSRFPLRQGEIVNRCLRENQLSPGVFHDSSDYFYIIRIKESELDKIGCILHCNHTYLSRLMARIMKDDTNFYSVSVRLDECNHFLSDGYVYYIIYNINNHPIVSIDLNKLDEITMCSIKRQITFFACFTRQKVI